MVANRFCTQTNMNPNEVVPTVPANSLAGHGGMAAGCIPNDDVNQISQAMMFPHRHAPGRRGLIAHRLPAGGHCGPPSKARRAFDIIIRSDAPISRTPRPDHSGRRSPAGCQLRRGPISPGRAAPPL